MTELDPLAATGQSNGVQGLAAIPFGSDSPNLDVLRSLAVLCVFARHIVSHFGDPSTFWFQPQALGIFGVMAFFVHTSLVLMMSLERHARRSGSSVGQLYLNFLTRRAFRIYPLSCVVVILCWFLLPPAASDMSKLIGAHADSTRNLLANFTLTNNLVHEPYALGTLWSLPLELQMYLFLPLFYLLVRRIGGLRLLALWPVFAVLAFVCRYKVAIAPEILGYVPCFVGGVIAYRMPSLRSQLGSWTLPIVTLLILILYMVGYGLYKAEVPLGWIVCLALGVVLPSIRAVRSSLVRFTAKHVAKYSYGIYLTHIGAIWAAFHLLAKEPPTVAVGFAVLVTAAASVVSYHLVEHPMIIAGTRIADRRWGSRPLPDRDSVADKPE